MTLSVTVLESDTSVTVLESDTGVTVMESDTKCDSVGVTLV